MSTPVQRQYQDLKDQNPDAILFFRLGDFYEMFFDDAKLCARVLGITLTARHKGTDSEMPMCGMPYHSHKEYLETLVSQGYKVAIAEQFEDENGKITRKVARIVTPGTSQEENLTPDQNNFLVGVVSNHKISKSKKANDQRLTTKDCHFALAVSDLSTGDFRTSFFENELLFLDEIYKLNPREILLESDLYDDQNFCSKLPKCLHTPRPKIAEKSARTCLQEHFKLPNLESFGLEKLTDQIEASALVLKYLADTQKTELSHIQKITPYSTDLFMHLDLQTFRHLEIFQPIYQEEKASTFVSVFEKPFTAMGGRMLRQWVSQPLKDVSIINQRLDGVRNFVENYDLVQGCSEGFKSIADLERLLGRICTGQGNPRDLAYLRDSLAVLPSVREILSGANSEMLKAQLVHFSGFEDLAASLAAQIVDHPPLEITTGGIIRSGVDPQLDELRLLSQNAKDWLDNYLSEQKEATGIATLRVKFSKNFGFCLEVSKGQADKAPETWTRRQTLVNAERFTTPELAEYEEKVLSAESQAYELEHQLFLKIRESVVHQTYEIQQLAQSIAILDSLLSLARTAQKWNWNQPTIFNNSDLPPLSNGASSGKNKVAMDYRPTTNDFRIIDGRHPVVEKMSAETFIANNCAMSANSNFHLITGPNMAGKSTYLRQNALIILLGQMGSFVPAREAEWSVFDRIFTRVGASDNLAGGKSTFFVEMTETAHILNMATDKSFVILDEIGRGTSTFDGISLAWAIMEFLHNKVKCKTLFATHYHELTELASDLPRAENYHISVSQNEDGIIFLRKIRKGGIADSFGIEVAKLAGVPKDVIDGAREVLQRLESENLLTGKPNLFNLPRQASAPKPSTETVEAALSPEDQKMLDFIHSVDPDELSPKEALEKWYAVKKQ